MRRSSVAGLELALVFELLGLGVVVFGLLCGWVASRPVLPGRDRPRDLRRRHRLGGGQRTGAPAAGIVDHRRRRRASPWSRWSWPTSAVLEYLGLRRLTAAH
jgi:hypothetical protein